MQNEESSRDEIDLIWVFLIFWKKRKVIYITIALFFLIGAVKVFVSQEEFIAEVKLIPETGQQSSLSGLTGLARQFGVTNVTRAPEEGIPSKYYPDIISSLPLLLPLLEYEIYVPEADENKSVYDYFIDHQSRSPFITTLRKYTIRLPFTIIGWFSSQPEKVEVSTASKSFQQHTNQVISLTNREWSVIRRLQSRIQVEVGRESGIVRLTAKFPDPAIAAEIANKVTSLLSDYITEYRTEKARIDMEFVKERHDDAKKRFELSQERLARFRDENRGQLTEMARTQEQRLSSEYDLAFNVYNAVSSKLEEARIKVQEETPVVKILEPAAVPNQSSEPKIGLTLIVFFILGGISGSMLIFLKLVIGKIRSSISEKNI